MAETVNVITEDPRDELLLMQKLELCTKAEIEKIKKKRADFECKLARNPKKKEDILQYIDYEITMVMMVRARKVQKKLPSSKSRIEISIANRVKKLFNEAILRYPNDLKIWISYIKFCKEIEFYASGREVFVQLLNIHGNIPSLFKFAANWELEACKSIEKARKHLQDGLLLHADSVMLHLELFRLQLIHINKTLNEKQDNSCLPVPDDIQTLDDIYDAAMSKINNLPFMVDLLECAKPYEFTGNLQNKIVSDMQTKFPNEELTWDTAAKMALHSSSKKKCLTKENLSNCISVYRTAVKTVNTEKMWSMYANMLIDLQSGKASFSSKDNDEIYFQQWLEKLRTDVLKLPKRDDMKLDVKQVDAASGSQDDESADLALQEFSKKWLRVVLQEATENMSDSVALWELRMRMHLVWGEVEGATAIFDEANRALQGAALPLWKQMLLYWMANDETKQKSKVEGLLKKGTSMKEQPDICNPLKVIWLERIAVSKGIQAARKFYFEIVKQSPRCLELHHRMMQLEEMQPECNVKYSRMYHILACIDFGTDRTDVWMDYLRFEKRYGKHSQMADVYHQACQKLNKSLVEQFKDEYNQLNQ
ncbi:U3 small nucleolar RNA-associated protein 6 homolog [Nilaparvata lugens]|uniref:U3 small nucleolar RNA-associated protein 6 homolog n=1 Tax=Nilaparvata lugens TaxID=108931 RepID=UPI00193C91B7|nr:U3 small nucleolar RNA-associated protein 6 homolog [Nilaparvata lugens]